ncbi:hypothetical protein GCM10022278_15970 [Allohahella marinimesophila]|uniref:Uncharacterized protein n=2 Tax=Allohahella marinimesophila TaxID=1054972 RepID=A0ABP7P1Y9_9GAMM
MLLAASLQLFTASPNAWSTEACGSDQIQAIATEFRKIRTVAGHFNGADWHPEVDAYDGRKHQLMQVLAERAPEEGLGGECLALLLGEPDELTRVDTPTGASMLSQIEWENIGSTSGEELLTYDWRGRHDRLVFLIRDARTLAAGWLLSYE